VVIADDVDALRALARALLGDDPEVEVVGEAADGREALEVVERERPDVLLLDLSMPGADGLEVLAALQARRDRPAVVIFSAFGAERLAARALEAGAVGYVEKGAPPEELIAAIKSACEVA
jgi:DNA-binding NarL/FixJ family response regulator